jgi:hypothetical protein
MIIVINSVGDPALSSPAPAPSKKETAPSYVFVNFCYWLWLPLKRPGF